jgi:hypothetical protein
MTEPYLRRHYAAAVTGCLVLAVAFSEAVLDYWRYFHMGPAGGRELFITFMCIPGSFALAVIVAILLMLRWEGDGMTPRRAVVRGLGAVALMFAVFYTIEVCRTAQYRGAEAAEGTLADYAASIFGIR